MQVTGTIKRITETQEVGSKGFLKRELHLETEGEYPQIINIEFVQDTCTKLDDLAEGQKVEVSINLRGREWVSPKGETKVFNSLQGWKVEKKEAF